jgi:S-formylglutathione hydrolase
MYSYIVDELPKLIAANFASDSERMGILGHSMGGHGALTIHLRNPQLFKSVSAFAALVAPSQVRWGEKALGNYLGADKSQWVNYDTFELVKANPSDALLLVEQGGADDFLENQLKPELLDQACEQSGQKLQLNMREGYDHSYYFMASFIEDHINHHYQQLV